MNAPGSLARVTAACLLTLLAATPLAAQELGMRIIGDDDTEFGLLIARWLNEPAGAIPAPALIDNELVPLDEWELRNQRALREAIAPPEAGSP